jgi:hypothetical protein
MTCSPHPPRQTDKTGSRQDRQQTRQAADKTCSRQDRQQTGQAADRTGCNHTHTHIRTCMHTFQENPRQQATINSQQMQSGRQHITAT